MLTRFSTTNKLKVNKLNNKQKRKVLEMRKLIFILSLALCSLFANAQQLEPNYHYSFWSNWNIGAGSVYSKPFDVTNWKFDNGANIGADLRLEKPLSNTWTVRLDVYVPGFIDYGKDRYGNLLAGANLNLGKYFYLFADGGLSLLKTIGEYYRSVALAGDCGLGSHIWFSDNAKLYLEVGTDCVSKIAKENAQPFGKLGFMYCLGVTNKDKENIERLHEMEHNVPRSEYEKLLAEKQECVNMLESTINDLNNMRNCCQKNYEKYEQEIKNLKNELEEAKSNVAMPFSILFDKDSAKLSKKALEIIKQVAIEINRDGGNYTLYGFGDYTGGDEHNMELSELRANTVKDELVRNGVEDSKLKIVALGKTQYFGTPESYVNRRVMFAKD